MLEHDEDAYYENREINQYKQELFEHPHCSDPDHPGCAECEEED